MMSNGGALREIRIYEAAINDNLGRAEGLFGSIGTVFAGQQWNTRNGKIAARNKSSICDYVAMKVLLTLGNPDFNLMLSGDARECRRGRGRFNPRCGTQSFQGMFDAPGQSLHVGCFRPTCTDVHRQNT